MTDQRSAKRVYLQDQHLHVMQNLQSKLRTGNPVATTVTTAKDVQRTLVSAVMTAESGATVAEETIEAEEMIAVSGVTGENAAKEATVVTGVSAMSATTATIVVTEAIEEVVDVTETRVNQETAETVEILVGNAESVKSAESVRPRSREIPGNHAILEIHQEDQNLRRRKAKPHLFLN